MHIGGLTIVEGPAAGDGRVPRADPPAPAPGAALPPQARLHGARQRPPGVDRRPELQPRVPRPPHRAARAGQLGAAAGPDRADLLPAARPLQAAVGDVADRGPRGRPLRADHQDPPLADRRHRRRRPRDGAVRPLARPAADHALRRAPGSRTPSRAPPQLLAAGLRGAVRAGLALPEGAIDALAAPRARAGARPRGRRGHRRDRLGRAEPGAGNAAERADRPAPALRRRRPASSRTSRPSRTPSAGPSTTSCWRSSPARCATS